MTREEHLKWCKERALEYVDRGDIHNALSSMGSDLNKHPETRDHPDMMLGMALLMGGHMNTQQEARNFINGFN